MEVRQTEDKGTLIEIEGEHKTDGGETDRQLLDGKGIRPGHRCLQRADMRRTRMVQ